LAFFAPEPSPVQKTALHLSPKFRIFLTKEERAFGPNDTQFPKKWLNKLRIPYLFLIFASFFYAVGLTPLCTYSNDLLKEN
jgi:hypothetical protein